MAASHLEVINTLNYLYRFMTEGRTRGMIVANAENEETRVPFEFILYELTLIKSKVSDQEDLAKGLAHCLDDFATIDRLLQTYRHGLTSDLDRNGLEEDHNLKNLAHDLVSQLDLTRFSDAQTQKSLDEFLTELPGSGLKGAFFLHLGRYLLDEINSRLVFREKTGNTALLIKSFRFESWAFQAGLAVLGYLPILIEQTCPAHGGRVIIEQQGMRLFLLVEVPDRHYGIVMRTIERYGEFLGHTLQAGDLLRDPLHALALIHKFKLIELEFRYTHNLLFSARGIREQRELDLDEEFSEVNRFIQRELESGTTLRDVLTILMPAENNAVRPAMTLLLDKLDHGLRPEDKEEVKKALLAVKQHAPGTMNQLFSLMINGGLPRTVGSLFAKWLYSIHRLPVRKE